MKLLVIASLIALSFTTGFTCSKNTPEAAKTEATATEEQVAPAQEQMAQPAEGEQPAAAPTEEPAAQPEGENK